MKLIFHGGAKEVGRSCVELYTDQSRVLFDCGVKISTQGTGYPINFTEPENIDAVFISHAHIDHTGALPLLDHNGMNCPIFCTRVTKKLSKILLKDAFKVGKITGEEMGYEDEDINKVLDFMRNMRLKDSDFFKDIEFSFFDAGHIPGSNSIFLKVSDPASTTNRKYKTFLYTGDIKTSDTNLLKAAKTDFQDIDVLICETTYGNRDHPAIEQEEEIFLQAVENTIAKGGSVIVPVFAVGRAQEIILVLSKRNFGVPVYFDGMAKEATEIILSEPDSVADFKKLKRAFNKVQKVTKTNRIKAMSRQGIFVTTSGMLTGGAVMHYLKKKYKNENDSILLTSYQGPDTNGRLLLETGSVYLDGLKVQVRCQVKKFDFSAHADQNDLKNLIRKINPKKLILMHGDPDAAKNIEDWARAKDYDVHVPELGEIIFLN